MVEPFHTASRNFTYTADDLMNLFPGKTSVPCSSSIWETLPASSCRKEMLRLCQDKNRGIRLIVDESQTFLRNAGIRWKDGILEEYPHLAVKAFPNPTAFRAPPGCSGLRDRELAAWIKDVSI